MTDIVNNGDKAVTVKSVTPPTGTYRAIGLPKVGTVIKPGEAIPVGVVFTPQHNVTTNGSFTITPSRGTSVTVTLTGTGLAPGSPSSPPRQASCTSGPCRWATPQRG